MYWLQLSAEQGNSEARKLLDKITEQTSIEAEDIILHEGTENLNEPQQKISVHHTKTAKILATALVSVSLVSTCIGGYYFFTRGSGNAERTLDSYAAEQLDPSIDDVFRLAAYANPQQLKEADKRVVNFNTERNIADNPDELSEEWLFENGETPLHYAALYNHNPESIHFLISLDLDVNAVASTGTIEFGTPLYCTVKYGNTEAVKELLKSGANPNAYSSLGNMMQMLACEKNNLL